MTKNPRATAGPAALAVITLAALAAAAGYKQKPGTDEATGTSGEAGSKLATATATGDSYALRGFKLWEYDGRPCVLEVKQGSLNAPSNAVAAKLRACEPRMSESWKALDVGDGAFLTAVQVCGAPKGSDRTGLRGVRAWGAGLRPDGSLAPQKKPVSVELAGCRSWKKTVRCGKGKVATALRAHFDGDGKGFRGIELVCRSILVEG